MTSDINQKVLAAFRAEHKEQLEGIRALLAELGSGDAPEQPDRVDEAFRLAHSLKGGARVCDLRPLEALAHHLEHVFDKIRGGTLSLDGDVVRTINTVLDAIEDWMAEFDRGEKPVDPQAALAAVERLVHAEPQVRIDPQGADGDVAQRLIRAFCRECPPYVAGLRRFAVALDDERSADSTGELDEAFRLAHNLRGAAQAAAIASVETSCGALESLIGTLRDQEVLPDAAVREQYQQHLDVIDRELKSLADSCGAAAPAAREGDTAADGAPAPDRPEAPPESIDAARPPAGERTIDTVRISTESLDRLLRSSQQIVADSGRQQQLARELEQLRRQVERMNLERESIRRAAAVSFRRLEDVPEFHRLTAYFESVDRGVQSLVRDTRRLCAAHEQTSWLLKSRGSQLNRDVRHARMVPAEAVYHGLRKLVRDLAHEEDKQVEFRVAGFDVRADRMVLQALKDPLIHMLRNCIVHGVESPGERAAAGKSEVGHIDLHMETVGNRLIIEVADDGRGIDGELVARRAVERALMSRADLAERSAEEIDDLVFQTGFSTAEQVTELAGRGIGLSVVRDAVTRLQGEVRVSRKATAGTAFQISVPLYVSTHRLLLVSAGEQTYAIPLQGIERLLRIRAAELESLEGKPIVSHEGWPVPVVSLANVLGLDGGPIRINGGALPIAILRSGTRRIAVSVEEFLAEQELLVHDLDALAASTVCLGAVLLDNGEAALVLNPAELLQRARPDIEPVVVEDSTPNAEKRPPRVLIVDDSFTTRTLEKSILEANGYQVAMAVDGVEGLKQLKSEPFDLVISDVEMPRMDGFALLQAIKKDQRLCSTPVILVTSRARPEDREQGLDLGADAYIVKQKFDHQSLLNTIRQFVDVPRSERR